ncbi:kinase-like domain-containing protein [Aspergillus californicus]
MGSERATSPENKVELVKSLEDLLIIDTVDSEGNLQPTSTTFFLITKDEEIFYGHTPKNKHETTIAEYNAALHRVPDEEMFPKVPTDTQMTIAPELLDESLIFVKRTALVCHKHAAGSFDIPRALLNETLIMEQISKSPHPNIIRYLGCRVKRGYITCIILERLEHTLHDYVSTPEFQNLDKVMFHESVTSGAEYLHSLGLAHNDINPNNIMVRGDGSPVLIDFDSCQPHGKILQLLGTQGWCEQLSPTSEKKHDLFSLNKLKKWLQDPDC